MLNLGFAKRAEGMFRRCHVPEVRSSAVYVMGNYSPIRFGAKEVHAKIISIPHLYHLEKQMRKRMNHVPIQYLIRNWHFRYLKLKLKPPVFIPRLETEWIITLLKEHLETKQSRRREFVDLCCGSGVIGLSIAKELGYKGVMVDLNPMCVKVTNRNKELNKIEGVEVINTRFEDYIENTNRRFDIVISNPPYIKDSDVQDLQRQVKRYQSHLALKGGQDGLDYVRYLLDNYQKVLSPDGILLIEYGGQPLQGEYQKYQKYVVVDQYEKRRFIIIENKEQ